MCLLFFFTYACTYVYTYNFMSLNKTLVLFTLVARLK